MPRTLAVLALLVACAPSDPMPPAGRAASPARVLDPGCVGSAYLSIQDAIDDADDGDVLEICAGTYLESLVVEGKQLTLRGTAGAAATVIDAQGLDRALSVEDGADVVVEGLTFANGDALGRRGGNVRCDESTLVLRTSVLRDGTAVKGGGLSAWGCGGLVEDSTFERNTADKGGAAYVEDEGQPFDAHRNLVRWNRANVQGGGFYFYSGAPIVDGNTFHRNFAVLEGGGLRFKIAEGVISNNVFTSNAAGRYGGGLKVSHDEVVMTGNSFVGNSAVDGAGAAYLVESASLLSGEHFEGNAGDVGGAIAVGGGWGDLTIEDSTFVDNEARDGGHVWIALPGYTTRFRRVDLVRGVAERGGAIRSVEGDVGLENTLLDGNRASVSGGALHLEGATGRVANVVAVRNDAPVGAALAVEGGIDGLEVVNTVISENTGGAAFELVSGVAPALRYDDFSQNAVDFAGVASPIGLDGNLAVAPGFLDSFGGDFALDLQSALRDAGDPALLDPDGTRSDVGLHGGPSAQ